MVEWFLGIFASLIGSAAAVALGVWFALLRIRRERGYDRRLAWCESMMAALTEAGIAVTSAAAAENEEAAERCWSETLRAYERLIPLAAQRDLYAPAREALRRGAQTGAGEVQKLTATFTSADVALG
jgi:hypothetical protein